MVLSLRNAGAPRDAVESMIKAEMAKLRPRGTRRKDDSRVCSRKNQNGCVCAIEKT